MAEKAFCANCNRETEIFESLVRNKEVLRCQRCGLMVNRPEVRPEPADVASVETILCVDDEKMILGLLESIFTQEGFAVLTALDGRRGLQLAKEKKPDLVLLDVMMPGMDGFQVCRELRSDPAMAKLPIVILTAMQDPQLTRKWFEAGATLALRKPFDREQLLRTLRMALAMAKRG